ncbi:uncharacterized protein YrrD [Paenibacillus anaericanus]|uniref:Photosystem reaction center subunit H n=1 Tax=Paenibacillus anaericanus TaxID=170367 RepID=A0A3S1EDK7_9BACL|nr:PRC-barrel domain-containing protein [Paenibacillus anaericanus]MDQ0090047.1 uncharacterized protein YrrD [Paenibacillus anaericanus]RUT43340.1 photosystem reaction center subunit H [Paenibacillus anaericanus]
MRLQEMIGLAVYDVEGGKQVGKVLDIMLDDNWTITGILLVGKHMFSTGKKAVLWDDIVAYGEDAVMIRNQQAVHKQEAENIQQTFLTGNGKLKEVSVLTGDGTMIGHVTDVYFNHELGNTITGIEISDGFFSDVMEGRKMLPYTPGMTKGENVIMVPPLSEQLLENPMNSVNG